MNAVAEKENQTAATPPPDHSYVAPEVNIAVTKEGYVLEAEMPGVNKDGLSVHLKGNILTLEGRRAQNSVTGNLVYRESRPANYRRAFELGPEIDAERVTARIEQGVLSVQLPKAEQAKPRRITVS